MDRRDDAHDAASWLVGVGAGFLVLTLSSGAAVYRAAGDPATVSFVVASYVTLLLLFACLRAYERSPPAAGRGRIRAAVWSLTTLITAMFAWRVAAMMPHWSAALLVWALAGATTVGGFLAMFYRP